MKWGKKKQCSSSPSKPFMISQVLPTSWLTKFKQMSLNDKHEKVKQKGKWNSASVNPSSYVNTSGGGKFYGKDGDGFWRISFGEEDGVFRSVRRNSGYYYDHFDGLNSSSFRSKDVKFHGSNDMVSHVKKMKEVELFPSQMREKVAEIRTPRLRVDKEKKVKKENFQETGKIQRKSVVKNVYEMKGNDDLYEENLSYEWQKLKERKIEEVKSRNEEQRKSLYISRDLSKKKVKPNSKVRVSSPRTSLKAEICKIKAIEDMKKAKLKMKKKAKEISGDGGFQGLESFAVVKCSYDPEGDFRNSMIEMIKEQNISQPEELEELLACYLTLNSDEYHDMIIRVFRQVWFIRNQDCFYGELENNNKI